MDAAFFYLNTAQTSIHVECLIQSGFPIRVLNISFSYPIDSFIFKRQLYYQHCLVGHLTIFDWLLQLDCAGKPGCTDRPQRCLCRLPDRYTCNYVFLITCLGIKQCCRNTGKTKPWRRPARKGRFICKKNSQNTTLFSWAQ